MYYYIYVLLLNTYPLITYGYPLATPLEINSKSINVCMYVQETV